MTVVKSYPIKDCIAIAHQFGMEFENPNGECKTWGEMLEAFKPHMVREGTYFIAHAGRFPFFEFKDGSVGFITVRGSLTSLEKDKAGEFLNGNVRVH